MKRRPGACRIEFWPRFQGANPVSSAKTPVDKALVLLALLLALSAVTPGLAREKYDVWAKERIRYLHSKVIREPDNAQWRVLLAGAYFENRQNYEAVEHLQEALRLQPDFAVAHCNLAIILHRQARQIEAIEHYRKALQLDSTLVEAKMGLGTLLCRVDQEVAGLEYLDQVLQQDPGRLSACYNMAVAYHKLGNFKKAIAHLEKVRQADPVYSGLKQALSSAYFSQGLLHLKAEQPGAALEFFDQALKYKRYNANFYFAKGLAHMKREEFAEAEAAFKEAVKLETDHVPALHNLAVVCDQTGRVEEAVSYYQQVQALTPHLRTIDAVRHAQFDVEYLMK